MSDGFVTLNPGLNGEIMDEERVGPYGVAPFFRLRSRVVVAGTAVQAIADVIDYAPAVDACGLVVRPVVDPTIPQPIGLPGTTIVEYGDISSISSNIETTVVSFIVPVSQVFSVIGFVCSGNVEAQYILKVDGVTKMVSRSSPASPTTDISFKLAVPIATGGQTVALRAIHFALPVSADFNGTILGYLV